MLFLHFQRLVLTVRRDEVLYNVSTVANAIEYGRWYHVTFAVAGKTDRHIQLYINGDLQAQSTNSTPYTSSGTDEPQLIFGAPWTDRQNTSLRPNWMVDDVLVFDSWRDQAFVNRLAKTPNYLDD